MVSEYDRKCCLSIELTWISDLGSLRQSITQVHGLFASGESQANITDPTPRLESTIPNDWGGGYVLFIRCMVAQSLVWML